MDELKCDIYIDKIWKFNGKCLQMESETYS